MRKHCCGVRAFICGVLFVLSVCSLPFICIHNIVFYVSFGVCIFISMLDFIFVCFHRYDCVFVRLLARSVCSPACLLVLVSVCICAFSPILFLFVSAISFGLPEIVLVFPYVRSSSFWGRSDFLGLIFIGA